MSGYRPPPENRPTFAQLRGDQGDGWECPRCGCHDWRVVRSLQFGEVRKRERVCRHCKQVIRTVEVREEMVDLEDDEPATILPVAICSMTEDNGTDIAMEYDDSEHRSRGNRAKRARA